MADTEILQLRKEAERLNQLLTAVLFRNQQLEQQILAVEDFCRQANIDICSHLTVRNEVDSRNYAVASLKDGAKSPPQPVQEQNNGVISPIYSYPSRENGVNSSIQPHPEERDGVNSRPDAVPPEKQGVNPISNTPPLAAGALHTPPTHSTNAETKEHSIREFKLRDQLRALMINSTWSGLQNTVKIMICLTENPNQSIKDLRKLTGLSEDGVVKRIMSMEKYGLLVRARGQGLLLTPKAVEMINTARQ